MPVFSISDGGIRVPDPVSLAECTCVCLTDDFRTADEWCMHPDCLWGKDPDCSRHGGPGGTR